MKKPAAPQLKRQSQTFTLFSNRVAKVGPEQTVSDAEDEDEDEDNLWMRITPTDPWALGPWY